MGYSLSWVAVKGDAKAVYAALNLRPTGTREEVPESPICAAALPNGWTVVIFDHSDVADGQQLSTLSRLSETIYCFVEEHVMESIAAAWRAGNQIWFIAHDSQISADHLEVKGNFPSAFAVVRDRIFATAAAESGCTDYIFDIPIELAKELTGFRHDEPVPGGSAEPFEVLESIKKKKWWNLS